MTAATDASAAILDAGRERAGLTFLELAKLAGVDERYIWSIVRGRFVASPAVAELLADRLHLNDDERAEVIGLARAFADPKAAPDPAGAATRPDRHASPPNPTPTPPRGRRGGMATRSAAPCNPPDLEANPGSPEPTPATQNRQPAAGRGGYGTQKSSRLPSLTSRSSFFPSPNRHKA